MYVFTTYVAAWLSDILVESSTGTIPSVTGLSEITRTSAVRWLTTRELPLGCFKDTQYTASLFVALFNLVDLIWVLLLHHGKHERRVVLLLFYLCGFFFYVVGAIEFGSLACCGAWELCAILVQFSKVYLDVGPCFVACGLLFPLDQALLCEIIGLSHLVNGNANFFIASGCDIPGFELIGEVV